MFSVLDTAVLAPATESLGQFGVVFPPQPRWRAGFGLESRRGCLGCRGAVRLEGVEFGVDGGGVALVFVHHAGEYRGEKRQSREITADPQHPGADDLVESWVRSPPPVQGQVV